MPFCYKIFCFLSQMCLFTSLIIIIVSVLFLCLLAIAPWPFVFTILCNINVPFSIAKLSFHFTFVPFLPVSAYWTFCLYILVQYQCSFFMKWFFPYLTSSSCFFRIVPFHLSLCLFLTLTASWHFFCASWCNINALFMKHIALSHKYALFLRNCAGLFPFLYLLLIF